MKSISKNISLNDKWIEYNSMRIRGAKKVANKLLTKFIEELKREDQIIISEFSTEVCSRFLEEEFVVANNGTDLSNKKIRIQHPLFQLVIVPFLIDQFRSNNPVGFKWIGQFEQFFYSDDNTTRFFLNEINVVYPFETTFFFEKSYELEKDQRTLKLILNRIAQDLNYAVHEVPIGVLWEPKYLDKELNKFEIFYSQSNDKKVWKESLKDWQLIAKNWRIYLDRKNEFVSFEDYLSRNEIILKE